MNCRTNKKCTVEGILQRFSTCRESVHIAILLSLIHPLAVVDGGKCLVWR